jgi:hypothetical protein
LHPREHPIGAETPGPELGPLIVGCLAGATVLYGPFALEWLAYVLTGGGAS